MKHREMVAIRLFAKRWVKVVMSSASRQLVTTTSSAGELCASPLVSRPMMVHSRPEFCKVYTVECTSYFTKLPQELILFGLWAMGNNAPMDICSNKIAEFVKEMFEVEEMGIWKQQGATVRPKNDLAVDYYLESNHHLDTLINKLFWPISGLCFCIVRRFRW